LEHLDKFAYLGGFSGNCSGFGGSPFDIKTICGGQLPMHQRLKAK
jgi:hypothetical protein